MPRMSVEIEQETDGRWIADVVDLPGVVAYGSTPDEAFRRVRVTAMHALAGMIERGEEPALRVVDEIFTRVM